MMTWKLFGNKANEKLEPWNVRTMFGPNLNFAATEAYKLLRTNVMFSFADEGKGHVIGVTSSIQDEGKSSTACNLAYALSEAGVKVLLLEADLRRPSIPAKLSVSRAPGVTNLLVSRGDYKEMIQHCSLAPKMDILTSGEIPPNPSELLGSDRMAELMAQMKEDYDYIVVDLPPITVVSDTAAISKDLDGIVLVVRSEVSDQVMLDEAMRQLELVNLRVLGFVFRDTDTPGRKYGYRYRYGKKYYKYYREYHKK